MSYFGKITVTGDPEKLYECIAPEEMSYERSSFKIKKTKEGIEFDIEAKDATAFRATLSSISQILLVFEQAKKR